MESMLTQECALIKELPVVVKDIRQFVSGIQRPKLKDASWATSIFQYSRQLESRIAELHRLLADRHESFTRALDELTVSLRAHCLELTEKKNVKDLNARYAALTRSYEDFLAQLPGSAQSSSCP